MSNFDLIVMYKLSDTIDSVFNVAWDESGAASSRYEPLFLMATVKMLLLRHYYALSR